MSISFLSSKIGRLLGTFLGASLLLVVFLLAIAAAAEPANGQNPTIWLQTPPQLVDNNTEITVTIRISDAVNLYGAELSLDFDPAVLQVVDLDGVKPGVQIEPADCPQDDFMVTNMADNMSGTVEYAVTQLNPTAPVNGDCSMARIRFVTIQEATTALSFDKVILADPDGLPITTNVETANLKIGDDVFVYLPFILQP